MRIAIRTILISGLLMVLVLPVSLVGAQSDDDSDDQTQTSDQSRTVERDSAVTDRQTDRADRRAALDEQRVERARAACSRVQGLLDEAVTSGLNARSSRLDRYDAISVKLADLLERLSATDVDTTSLQASVDQFNSDASALIQQVDEYVVLLNEALAIDCDSGTIEDMLLAVDDAKALKATIKDATDELKQALRSIVSELQSIKNTLTPDRSGEDSVTDGEES